MCVQALAQKFGSHVVPQAHAELENMTIKEVDVSAQRGAILALYELDPVRVCQLFIVDDTNVSSLSVLCV